MPSTQRTQNSKRNNLRARNGRVTKRTTRAVRNLSKRVAALQINQSRRKPIPRRKTIPRPVGVHERLVQKGHEFFQMVTVPVATTIGQNLFQFEVNPSNIPRLSVIASQYKQWRGDIKMHVESLGNAFSLSSVTSAFFPDPDPTEVPTDPTSLLRVVDSAPSKSNLHLQDTVRRTVDAPWSMTTNPWKFLIDDDPSDRSNGLFIIVSNGTPGTDPVQLKISFSYNITFQGNTYQPMSPTVTQVTPVPSINFVATGTTVTATEITHPSFGDSAVPIGTYDIVQPLWATTTLGPAATVINISIIPTGSSVQIVSITVVSTGYAVLVTSGATNYNLLFCDQPASTDRLYNYWTATSSNVFA